MARFKPFGKTLTKGKLFAHVLHKLFYNLNGFVQKQSKYLKKF